MATEISIPVRLKILQDSIGEFQKVLSNLQPNTKNWKDLSRIIENMSSEVQKLQGQMSVPLTSAKQFAQTEKTIDRLQEIAGRTQAVMNSLKFSDIKLTPAQADQLKAFDEEIKTIETSYKSLQDTVKQQLLTNQNNSNLIQGLDKGALDKSFSEIKQAVEQHVQDLENSVSKQKAAFDKLRSNVELGERATALTSSDKGLTREALGQTIFDKYLTETDKGLRIKSWENGVTKQALLTEIEKMFSLNPGDLQHLADKTINEINQAFKDMGKKGNFNPFQALINRGLNDKKNQPIANEQMLGLQSQLEEYKRLLAEMESLKSSNGLDIAENIRVERIGEIEGKLRSLRDSIVDNIGVTSGYQSSMKQLSNQFPQLRSMIESTNVAFVKQQQILNTFNSMKMAITNFMGFNQVLNLVRRGVQEAANHIKELDTVMNRIAIVTDMDTGDLWDQIGTYSDMAQKYGVSIKGAYEVSQIYYQQGLDTADVMTLTNETLKLSKVSGLDYAASTDYMTTALRGFKMEMQDASVVVDVYSALAANTAVSQEELAVAMSKTASSMEGVGASFEEASAMIGTMVAVTRESATNIGSALKSIASRYGELTKDPTGLMDSEGEAFSFNKVDTALQSVGISMKTVDGQFRKFTDVIVELGEKWNTLDSTQQRYIATQFAGNRQQSRFLALVSNVDLLKENIATAENSEDTGTLQALKSMDSLETKIEQVKVAYQQFYTSIGAEEGWKSALDGIRDFINTLNGLPKLFGKIPIGAVAMIADIISLLKNAGNLLITGISKIWISALPVDQIGKTMGDSFASSMREAGLLGGKAFSEGMKEGSEEGAAEAAQNASNKAAEAVNNATQDANQPAGKQKKENEEAGKKIGETIPVETKAVENIDQSAIAVKNAEALNAQAAAAGNAKNAMAELSEVSQSGALEQSQNNVGVPTVAQKIVPDNTVPEALTENQNKGKEQPVIQETNLSDDQTAVTPQPQKLEYNTEEARAEIQALIDKLLELEAIKPEEATAFMEGFNAAAEGSKEQFAWLETVRDMAKDAETAIDDLNKKNAEGQVIQNQVQTEAEKQPFKMIDSKLDLSAAASGIPDISPEMIAQKQQLDELIDKMVEAGKISQEAGNQMKDGFSNASPEELKSKIQELTTELQKTGDYAPTVGEKISNAFERVKATLQDLSKSGALGSFGSALTMIAGLINKSSRDNQVLAGSITALGGAIKLVDGISKAAAGSNPWMAIAMGVMAVANGISMIIETDSERLERLTKKADDTANKAKQTNAQYKDLSKSASKIDELSAKRYESAESAEEYSSAVEDLASKFPNLILAFDNAGNAILDTANMEKVLEESRLQAARAAEEAAQAERDLAKENLEQAARTRIKPIMQNLRDLPSAESEKEVVGELIDDIIAKQTPYGSFLKLFERVQGVDDATGFVVGNREDAADAFGQVVTAWQNDRIKSQGEAGTEEFYANKAWDAIIQNYLAESTEADENGNLKIDWNQVQEKIATRRKESTPLNVEETKFFEYVDTLLSIDQSVISQFQQYQKDIKDNSVTGAQQKLFRDIPQKLQDLFSEENASDETVYQKLLSNINSGLEVGNYNYVEEQYQLLTRYYSLLKDSGSNFFKRYGEDLQSYIDQLEDQMITFKSYSSTFDTANRKIISDQINRAVKLSDNTVTQFVQNRSALLGILTDTLEEEFSEKSKENPQLQAEEFMKDSGQQEAIEETENFYRSLEGKHIAGTNEKAIDGLERMLADTKHYSATDIFEALGIEEEARNGDFEQRLIQFYKNRSDYFHTQLKNNIKEKIDIQAEKGKTSEGLQKLLDTIGSKDFEELLLTGIDQDYFNSLINQVNDLENQGFSSSASQLADYGLDLWEQLQSLQETQRNIILDALSTNGIQTAEGISKTLKVASQNGIDLSALKNIYSMMAQNLQLAASSLVAEATESWQDVSKKVSNLSSGISFTEVQNYLDEAKNLGIELKREDFQDAGKGKLKLSVDKVLEYWNALRDEMDGEVNQWVEDFNTARNELQGSFGGKELTELTEQDVKNFTLTDDARARLQKVMGDGYTAFFDENEELIDAKGFAKALSEGSIKTEDFLNSAVAFFSGAVNELFNTTADISGYLKGNRDQESKNKLREEIKSAWASKGQVVSDSLADWYISELEKGGIAAQIALQKINPKATEEELAAVYTNAIDRYADTIKQLEQVNKGDVVTGQLREILTGLNMVDPLTGVVKETFNMVQAYQKIYDEMKVTAGATTAGLNDAYAQLLTIQDQTNIDITEALKNGNGMSYADFGNLLAKYDIKFEDYMTDHWDTVMRDGFGNIRITDWEGFAKNIFKTDNLDAIRNTDEYISAFKAYNDGLIELNKNTEEAITEEIQQITGAKAGDWLNLTELWTALEDSLASKDWTQYMGQAQGNQDYAKSLAKQAWNQSIQGQLEQWGATFENGILKLGDNVNLLGIAQTLESAAEQAGLELGNGLEEVKDTVLDILGAYTEAITNGIKGGLDNFSAQDLRKKADNIGITNLHFEQTIDGLKLSQQSAIELYQAISKIDAIQGNIVFQELSESLKESNENFATTSALLNRVKTLTEAIVTGREKINGVDQEVSSARLEQYKAELEVVKEIVSVRSAAEDESFNFMNQKIPSGQNNPLNYAKNWTQAVKSIKEAYKVWNTKDLNAGGVKRTRTGYMGYEDFYNIVNELNNMAGMMNQPITIGKDLNGKAIQLKGDLTSASDAIMAGIETLTAVDTGDMMVNIGALGINLAKGGSELEGNIDKGIDAIADAQIHALDGMIAMLELIVAMEELGDIAGEDMTIGLPDIAIDEDGDGTLDVLNKKYTEWLKKFDNIYATNKQVQTTVDGIVIDGLKWRDWLHRGAEQWSDADAQILDALYQAAISSDWNLDDIGGSLQQLLNSGKFAEGLKGRQFTIDIGKITYTISNGVVVEVADWSNEQAQEILKQYKKNRGYGKDDDAKARSEIASLIQKYLDGEGATSKDLSLTDIIKIRHSTLIKHDKKGDYIEGPNGERYDPDSDGWNEAVQAAVLNDQQGINSKDEIKYDDKTKKSTVVTEYGIKNTIKMKATVGVDGKVTWLLDNNEFAKLGEDWKDFTPNNANTQAELLDQLYNYGSKNALIDTDTEGKTIRKEAWIYQTFGIHLKINTEVLKDNETVQDPTKDYKFRNVISNFMNQSAEQIKKQVSSNGEGKIEVDIGAGYKLVLDADDIDYDVQTGNYDNDLLLSKLREAWGIDEALKNTISEGIQGAIPSLVEALGKLEPGPAQNIADAMAQIEENASGALEKVESLVKKIHELSSNGLSGSDNNTVLSEETVYIGEPAPGALLTPAEAYATQVNIDIAGAEAALFGVPNEGTSEIVDGKAEVFSVDISDAEVQLNGDEVKAVEGSSVTITNPITGVPSSLDPLDMTYLEKDLGQQQVEQGTTITVTNAITAFLQEIVPELGDGAWPATIEIGSHTISTDSLVTVILEKLLPKDGTTGTSLGTITLAGGKTVDINDVITAYLKFIKADASQATISNSSITLPDGVTLPVEQAHAIIRKLILSLSEGVIQSAANNIDIPSDIYSDKTTTIHVKTNLKYSPSDEIPIDGNDLYTAIQNAITESSAPGDLPFVDEIMNQLVYSGLEDPKIYDSVQAYVNKLSDMYNADFTSENFLGDFSSWLEQNKDIPPINIPVEPDVDDLEIEDFEEPVTISTELDSGALTDSATEVGQNASNAIATGIESGEKNISNAVGSIRTHITELGDTATVILSTIKDLLAGLQQHVSITGDVEFKTPFGNINGKSGIRGENGKINFTVEGEEQIQKVKDEAAEPIQMTIGATTDPAINALNELIATIESTYAEASVGLTSQPSQIQSQINSRTYTASVQLQPTGGLVPPHATGNLGLAQAKGTLMGELGPELVVSNGRYFVAGQNGAEMVNLADDAIVFNHLQTEQLLKHGMSSGRGKAVTSEKNAVAFATGNTGPAMASASAALAALKQLRAMWESLKGASISDLAGAGGGGGGGGGDKAVDPSIWVDTVERWYNLMQKIAKLEKEITHEETLRSKLESDWNANGNHYYASQKRSLEALRDQIDAQEQLNLSRQAYYDQRVEALEKSPFGKLIRFDDEGQMFFQEGAMEWLTKLAGFDSEGKANYTDEEKYDILMKAGYGDYMKYDSDGGEIKKDSDGDGEVTDDELQTFYGDATKAFWDRIDDYKETTQSLWDSIKDGEDSLLNLQADQNSLLEEIRENQMEVEDEVLKAIEDLRQREIDALQDERDKLEESTQKYIDGLTDALNREQEMYQNQEDETSLNQQRRRLAILQRSGGSAEDIASLRSEIDSSERERYFNLQQQQIDAIQAASDLEIERMDSQIEIMTETLEYQKEYGLLWGNVYAVMQESADKIVSFIMHGNSEFWTSSELASQKAINEQLFAAEQWTSYREDLAAAKASIGENGVTAKDISENVQLMATMTRHEEGIR